jgi:alpha-N-acetylglucosamine transferase
MLAVFAQKRIVAITAAFFAICLLLVSSRHYYYAPPSHKSSINTAPVGNGHVEPPFEHKHDVASKPLPATPNNNKPIDENLLEHMPDGLDNVKPNEPAKHDDNEKPRPDVPASPDAEAHHIVSEEHGNPNNTGTKADGTEKLAYVTFLSGTLDQDEDLEADNYFLAIRILVWQLLHNLETRTKDIDVVVMVTPSVSQSRRSRLEKDGAIIYPVEFLRSSSRWAKAEDPRWDDVMTKLRVWEMTQYSRILVMDGDSMLLKPLDGVFNDPGTQIQTTKQLDNYTAIKGEAPLPPTYLLASLSEVWDSTHEFPPTHGTGLKKYGYMNAGFFLLAPSIPAFEHYRSFLEIPDSFDPKYPEQNLLNQVHSWDGPMPWTEVAYTWNIRCPSDNDIDKGLVSLHEKWWTQPYLYENQRTKDWLKSRRWEMKGFYDAYDRFDHRNEKEKA